MLAAIWLATNSATPLPTAVPNQMKFRSIRARMGMGWDPRAQESLMQVSGGVTDSDVQPYGWAITSDPTGP